MAKLRLDLDTLNVQSFATDARLAQRGTVQGNVCSQSTCHERICTCTDGFGNCEATLGCSAGGGTGGGGTTDATFVQTCATGNQRLCSCPG
jgi:hypothetical protein